MRFGQVQCYARVSLCHLQMQELADPLEYLCQLAVFRSPTAKVEGTSSYRELKSQNWWVECVAVVVLDAGVAALGEYRRRPRLLSAGITRAYLNEMIDSGLTQMDLYAQLPTYCV